MLFRNFQENEIGSRGAERAAGAPGRWDHSLLRQIQEGWGGNVPGRDRNGIPECPPWLQLVQSSWSEGACKASLASGELSERCKAFPSFVNSLGAQP